MPGPTRLMLISAAGIIFISAIILAMLQLPLKDRSAWSPSGRNDPKVTILTLGDYGEGDYRQRRVAAMMEAACRTEDGETLVQTVGDNFYPDGVRDIEDPQWQSKFEKIYDTPCLMQTSFFAALGNHDYGGSIEAQSEYQGQGTGRWQMPANFYVHDHGTFNGHVLVRIVVVDTMTDLKDQISLITEAFADPTEATWRIVVGHFNVRTFSKKYHDNDKLLRALLPTLQANRVHFYLSGHSHNLQLIEFPPTEDRTAREPVYVIAGGGGASPRELVESDPGILKLARQDLGFAALTFTPEVAEVSFTETSGKLLSTFAVNKQAFKVDRACLESTETAGCVR